MDVKPEDVKVDGREERFRGVLMDTLTEPDRRMKGVRDGATGCMLLAVAFGMGAVVMLVAVVLHGYLFP